MSECYDSEYCGENCDKCDLIVTEANYARLLAEATRLIEADPEPDSPEGERLNRLVDIIEAYEKEEARDE